MDKLATLLLDKSVEQIGYASAALSIAISYAKGWERLKLETARDQLAVAELTLREVIKPF